MASNVRTNFHHGAISTGPPTIPVGLPPPSLFNMGKSATNDEQRDAKNLGFPSRLGQKRPAPSRATPNISYKKPTAYNALQSSAQNTINLLPPYSALESNAYATPPYTHHSEQPERARRSRPVYSPTAPGVPAYTSPPTSTGQFPITSGVETTRSRSVEPVPEPSSSISSTVDIDAESTQDTQDDNTDYNDMMSILNEFKSSPSTPQTNSLYKSEIASVDSSLTNYSTATTPEQTALKNEIIRVTKKLLSKKNLDRARFKHFCFHVTGNIFTRLCQKPDLSNPSKMVRSRKAKIAKLIEDELANAA